MSVPGIRLVEQPEQKFRRIRVCLKEKKRVTVIVGLFYIKAPTKNIKLQLVHYYSFLLLFSCLVMHGLWMFRGGSSTKGLFCYDAFKTRRRFFSQRNQRHRILCLALIGSFNCKLLSQLHNLFTLDGTKQNRNRIRSRFSHQNPCLETVISQRFLAFSQS